MMPYELEFVNHASFIVNYKGVKLICDPWLFGSSFHNGWNLLVDTKFETERFKDIQYIWFSHEHPDHFSPAVLKAINEEVRANITILYHYTKDKKVLKFCQQLGFKTDEIKPNKKYTIIEGFDLFCNSVPFFDSWLVLKLEDKYLLNLNDCVLEDSSLKKLKNKFGQFEILFSQFSYAGWKGNPKDKKLREISAQDKLHSLSNQISILKPEYTVPFASFIYFSHEENKFNNDSVNKLPETMQTIEKANSKPLILFPQDCWSPGNEFDSTKAIKKYEKYFDISKRKYHRSSSVELDTLIDMSHVYIKNVKEKNNRFLIWLLSKIPILNLLRPITIFLTDLKKFVRFSLQDGLKEISELPSTDVQMSSESLDYLFRFEWGFDTLTVNGRFQTGPNGFSKMTRAFMLGLLNNTHKFLKFRLIFDVSSILFLLRLSKRFLGRLRQYQIKKA